MKTGPSIIPGLLLLCTAVLCGCAPDRYVLVENIRIQTEETDKGSSSVAVKTMERADRNVIEKSANVKSVTKVTDFKGNKVIGTFDISPDGDKLLMAVFETEKGETVSQVWTYGTSGMGLTRVTAGRYQDLDPVFSHDGKHIYFSSNRVEQKPKIWRIQSTGMGGMTRISSGSTSDRMPDVSPRGEEIAYAALMPQMNEWQLWSVNINGALSTQLAVGNAPVYSPDGKKILFTRTNADTQKEDIWIMNADGSFRTQMTNGDANYLRPRWSPDAKRIVFAADRGTDEEQQANYDIWIMNADGTNLTRLTDNGSCDDLPVFDPKGKYIYFRSNRGGQWDIWRMELAL